VTSAGHAPAIRARSCQDTLAYLDVFAPGKRAEVERRLDPDVRETIEATIGSAWIPIEVDAAMARTILAVLGRDETLRFLVRYITHHLDSPLLAGPVKTALSLLGATPGSLVKWMPRATSAIYRDLFELHIDVLEPDRATYHYDVLSDVFFAEPVYEIVVEATMRALFVITGAAGEVRVRREVSPRTFAVEATWAIRG
jgi:hypothetical protein